MLLNILTCFKEGKSDELNVSFVSHGYLCCYYFCLHKLRYLYGVAFSFLLLFRISFLALLLL